MTPPSPDRHHVLFQQPHIRPPFGLHPHDAYDLTLYRERGQPHRGVLMVSMVLQFQFREAEHHTAPTWTDIEKHKFALLFRDAIYRTWGDRHRLSTTSPVPDVRDVAVLFDIRFVIKELYLSDHWKVEVTRIEEDFRGSQVNILTGKVTSDSQDLRPVAKMSAPSGVLQRGAVHEFGHMLGLRDEYPSARNPARTWVNDAPSVMHSGEMVRDRHYAPFAHWLTQQSQQMARLAGAPIEYRVNGTLTPEAARL